MCFTAPTHPFLCHFLWLEQEMSVKVLSQYNNLAHTTSRTGHLSLPLIALIKPSLQEVNCSTFCRLLCFYWLTHFNLWNLLKTSPAWRALTLAHIIMKCVCSHGRTCCTHVLKRTMCHRAYVCALNIDLQSTQLKSHTHALTS